MLTKHELKKEDTKYFVHYSPNIKKKLNIDTCIGKIRSVQNYNINGYL